MSVIKRKIKKIIEDPIDCGVVIAGDVEDDDRPTTRMRRKSAFSDREEVWHRDAKKHMAYLDKEIIPLLVPLHTETKYGIMGILAGHHWTQLSPVLNSVQYMSQELKRITGKDCPYLGEMSAFMDITFEQGKKAHRIVGHVQHGSGGGQTKASSINQLEKAFQSFEADFYIRAHSCQRIGSMTDRLYPTVGKGGKSEIKHKTVSYLNLGASTRSYVLDKDTIDYPERAMMRPTTLGWGHINFTLERALTEEDPNRNIKVEMAVTV